MNYPYLVSLKRSVFSLIFSCLFFVLAFALGLPTLGLPILSQPAFAAAEPATGGPITISPRDDFPGWYAQWEKNIPQNYRSASKDYFGFPSNNPKLFNFLKYSEHPYSLKVVFNSSAKLRARFIRNKHYCAFIESNLTKNARWKINAFASKEQPDYPKMQNRLGGDSLLFLGTNLKRLEGGVVTKSSESGPEGKRIKKIVYTFNTSKSDPKGRDLKKLTLLLDESIGWLPKEIISSEINGTQYRFLYKQWAEIGKTWLFHHSKIYQLSPGKKELLHSTVNWKFKNIEPENLSTECYFSHYGLPEPKVASKGNYTWWLMLLAAVLLSGGGCWFLKRLKRQ